MLGNHTFVKIFLIQCATWICIRLLGTFVNSSCDIKMNIKIVQNCCRKLAVRGLINVFSIITPTNRLIMMLHKLQGKECINTNNDINDILHYTLKSILVKKL